MKSIIIVSKCLRVIKFESHECYEFHFKGIFKGQLIKKIRIEYSNKTTLLPGKEYLVHLRDPKVNESVLEGTIVRVRLLDECFDKS